MVLRPEATVLTVYTHLCIQAHAPLILALKNRPHGFE
jgi:hypothetical protein